MLFPLSYEGLKSRIRCYFRGTARGASILVQPKSGEHPVRVTREHGHRGSTADTLASPSNVSLSMAAAVRQYRTEVRQSDSV
jgi:hypothetical protein